MHGWADNRICETVGDYKVKVTDQEPRSDLGDLLLYEIRLGVQGREMGFGKISIWEKDTQKIESTKYPTRHAVQTKYPTRMLFRKKKI